MFCPICLAIIMFTMRLMLLRGCWDQRALPCSSKVIAWSRISRILYKGHAYWFDCTLSRSPWTFMSGSGIEELTYPRKSNAIFRTSIVQACEINVDATLECQMRVWTSFIKSVRKSLSTSFLITMPCSVSTGRLFCFISRKEGYTLSICTMMFESIIDMSSFD